MNLGVFLHRKLKEAIDNHTRQQTIFSEFLDACSEPGSKKIDKWDEAIQQWEEDHSKPDPYDESEYGKQFTKTMERCALITSIHSRNAVGCPKRLSKGGRGNSEGIKTIVSS